MLSYLVSNEVESVAAMPHRVDRESKIHLLVRACFRVMLALILMPSTTSVLDSIY
jgi:hypothetical protein